MKTKAVTGILLTMLFLVVVSPIGVSVGVVGARARQVLDNASGRDAWSRDLFELELEGLSREHPETEHVVETISVSIPLSECSIHKVGQYDYLQVQNLKPFTRPGEPQLPMKTFVIHLPKNSEVLQVNVVNGSYREFEGKLYLAPTPQPVAWAPSMKKSMFDRERLILDESVYSLETYFPGKAVSYDKGSDNKGTLVFVRFYPVQYVPARKKVFLITDVVINIYHTVESFSESQIKDTVDRTSGFSLSNAVNIIITPPILFQQAYELKSFHDNAGITTVVVNTTWIYENYVEASDPPYNGYYNSSAPGWGNIIGYNYSLARCMISFLMDVAVHPSLASVTLLGNAWLVPPSYYIYIWNYPFDEYYNNWIPTDFFYGSPDYDLVPNYEIGRIPVNNAQEAEHVISKIESWNSSLSYEWFQNVVISGGMPFETIYYYGEMITIDSVNRESFTGMNITKRFHTQGDFNPQHLIDAFSGDTGMLYIITHGYGYGILPDGQPLDVNDLLALPSNSRVPVVVSIACMDGAFDTNVLYGGFDTSFGQGVLLSSASGIAYIGGSRINYGAPYFYLDDGEVHITKEPYMAGMLTYVFEAYHNGTSSLGGIAKAAMEKYVTVNSMSDFINNVTLFEFCLLGDPALQLPPQQPGDAYLKPDLTAVDPEDYTSEDAPWYFNETIVTISSETDSPNITMRRLRVFDDLTVDLLDADTVGGWFNYTFEAEVGTYLARFASYDCKEGWIYVEVIPPLSGAQMLVIDDDQGDTYEEYYQNAISSCGYTYDTWRVNVGSPSRSLLSQYPSVIWLTGDSRIDTLSLGDRKNLEEYLDGGGCLFISGQNIGSDIGGTTFYQNYLHANYVRDDTNIYTLEGISGDPISDRLNIGISGGDGAGNQRFPSEIEPADIYTLPVFEYTGDGYGSIHADTGFYKVVYFAFGFEAINTSSDRDLVMCRVLDFFGAPPTHDVAVTNVTPSKTVVAQGYSISINVTVENQGTSTESFDVTVYANEISIALQTVTLTSGSFTTITFTWDTTGFDKINYTVSAYATLLVDEIDTADNRYVDGTVIVTILGDVDGNGHVDVDDLYYLLIAYGAKMGDPDYDPNVDIDCDGGIDLDDLYQVLWNYGA